MKSRCRLNQQCNLDSFILSNQACWHLFCTDVCSIKTEPSLCLTIHSVCRLQNFESVDVAVLVEVVVPEVLHDHLRLAQVLDVDVLLVNMGLEVTELVKQLFLSLCGTLIGLIC